MSTDIYSARAGDFLLFRSGPRRIERVYANGVELIQLRNGRIGGGGNFLTTVADGRRMTSYLYSDLAQAHVRSVIRGEPKS